MKKRFLTMMVLLATSSILMTSCSKSEDETTTTSTRSASFKVGSTAFTVTKPYLGIFNDNGVIKNTMTLTATDGSEIEFYFEGSAPATYQLMSFSDAFYTNAAGKQYNSTSGQLIVTNYTVNGATYKATGTFSFKALAISAPIDSVSITAGVFTNASNEF